MREIQIGKKYKHFKNKMYEVIDIVLDSETNNDEEPKKIVVYKHYMEITLLGQDHMICLIVK